MLARSRWQARRLVRRSVGASIRTQILALVLAVSIPLTIVIVAQGVVDAGDAIEASRQNAHVTAVQVERRISEHLALAKAQAATIAGRPLVAAVDPANCDPDLAEMMTVMPDLANIGIVSTDGLVICSVVAQPGGQPASVAETEWFERMLRERGFVVGKPFIGPITHRWVSVLAYPILAPTGEVKGIVALPIDLVRYLSTARARGPLDDVGRSQGEVGSSRPHP